MMNKKEIFRKIGGIIAEITEQYQYLSDNPEKLNSLELELFSANSDFLAEHVKVLKKLNSNESEEKAEPGSAAKGTPSINTAEEAPVPEMASAGANETSIEEKPSADESAMATKSTPSQPAEQFNIEHYVEDISPEILDIEPPKPAAPEKKEVNEPAEETAVSSPVAAPAQTTPIAPVVEEKPVVQEVVIPEKVTAIVVEEPAKPAAPPTLNEIISAQREQKSASTTAYNTQAVKDLKSIISLNDKLLFIKDLFNGYSLAYSEAVELINRFDSFQAADNFLKTNYAEKNNWAAKQSTVDKFYELLTRRFTK